ncbi:MAG: hypothetical protein Rhims3KO_18060 [Hyphomicrobiales bacterium]
MSSLPNTIPNIVAPSTPDRIAPRSDETSRARSDDRFADRLDRETTRADSPRTERSRDEARQSETARPETDRGEKVEAPEETEAASQSGSAESTEEQSTRDDNNQETPAGNPSAEQEPDVGPVDLAFDAALAFLSEMEGVENTELTITARSGETISLTPPAASVNGQSEPGSLGRWFVEASGPTAQGLAASGPDAQMAGLLAKMGPNANQAGGGATDLSSLAGQGVQNGQIAEGPEALANSQPANNLPSAQGTSFADALASSASAETMDAMMGQGAAKAAAAAVDALTSAATPVAPAPTAATAAQPTMTAVPQSTAGQAVPVAALAVEINRQAMNGKTQFEIRLDPPELGRLNVKLEVDGNGQTRTHMVVERGETLDMLTTDSRSLERALQQVGLKAEPGSVTFELAQDFNEGLAQNGNQSESGENNGNEAGSSDGASSGDENLIPELTDMSSVEAVRQQLYLTGHLDVRV